MTTSAPFIDIPVLTFTVALTGQTFHTLHQAQTMAVHEMRENDLDEAWVIVYVDGVRTSAFRFGCGKVSFGWHREA
jgi:hypothetical protein